MGGWRWPVVQLAAPEHDGWGVVHHLLRGAELPERLCSDAHLAALAIANGWRLVSSDRDGERSEGLELLRLRSIRGGGPASSPSC